MHGVLISSNPPFRSCRFISQLSGKASSSLRFLQSIAASRSTSGFLCKVQSPKSKVQSPKSKVQSPKSKDQSPKTTGKEQMKKWAPITQRKDHREVFICNNSSESFIRSLLEFYRPPRLRSLTQSLQTCQEPASGCAAVSMRCVAICVAGDRSDHHQATLICNLVHRRFVHFDGSIHCTLCASEGNRRNKIVLTRAPLCLRAINGTREQTKQPTQNTIGCSRLKPPPSAPAGACDSQQRCSQPASRSWPS